MPVTWSKPSVLHSHQRGAVLILALVILLVLTLLGVSAMNSSSLQMLMTGNTQYQTVALSQAELTIRQGETLVDDIAAGTTAPPAIGYYDIRPGKGTEVDLTTFTWDDTAAINFGASYYIIEYAGDKKLRAETLAWREGQNIAGDSVSVYRVTARSPATRGALRYVQSIYVTEK